MNRDDDPERVPQLLEGRGYTRVVLRNLGYKGPEQLLYRAPENRESVSGYVLLEKKPRQNAYSIAFGVACKSAVELLRSAAPSLCKSASATMFFLAEPYAVFFSAGRRLKCALINIPDSTDPRSFSQLLDEFVDEVLRPFVEGPASCLDVLSILRRDDLGFEWAAWSPASRAAHFVATARVGGLDRRSVEGELLAVLDKLRGTNREDWSETVQSVVNILWPPGGAMH